MANTTARLFFKRLSVISIQAVGVICILIAALGFYKNQSDREKYELSIKKQLSERVSSLDYKIESIKKQVNISRYQIQNYYAASYENNLFRYLKRSDIDHYSLDGIPDSLRVKIGNIVGGGNLDAKLRDPHFYKEIQAQFSMGPLFECVYREFPDLAWVYTISRNEFVHMYPFAPSDTLQYNKGWLDYDIFVMGLPESNPQREIYITPVYLDAGGKGLMISVGVPLYYNNTFRAIAGADLTIKFLSDFTKTFAIEGGELIIVNERNQLVAHPTAIRRSDREVKSLADVLPQFDTSMLRENETLTVNGKRFFMQRMNAVPWQVIFVSHDDKYSLMNLVNEYYGVLLSLLAVIFFLISFTYFNYIKPSLQLVSFIEKCSKNSVVQPARVHAAWVEWFNEVSLSFEKKENLINILDTQVQEQTMALQRANRELIDQREALIEANTMKDRIFSIISHDLRSPLNSLMGVLSIINAGVVNEREKTEQFGEVERRVKKLSLMLENLLQWSLCNLNAFKYQVRPVDLNKAIRDNIELLESLAIGKNLQIKFHETDDVVVNTDRSVLDLVLRNLIYNAIKFSFNDGQIEIKTVTHGRKFVVHVRDHGKGIPEHVKEKLFKVGEGLQHGTSNEKGTGLGLRLSKDFLEKVGGRIEFQSEVNKGSVFSVTLPLLNGTIL